MHDDAAPLERRVVQLIVLGRDHEAAVLADTTFEEADMTTTTAPATAPPATAPPATTPPATTPAAASPLAELKAKHRVVWGNGTYERMPSQYEPLLAHLARVAAVRAGERVLDVATGTGALALRLAGAGGRVVGVDLAPALVERARRLNDELGFDVTYDVGDAESLPYDDGAFDLVTSSVGSIFAPDHAAVARELARVCRPGGRLVLGHWSAESGVVDMFGVLKAFQAPPPEGAGSPFAWGRVEYVEALLGDTFDLAFEHGDAPQRGASGEAVWEVFASSYGPVKTLFETLPADRARELHAALVNFFEAHRRGDVIHQTRPYVVVVGTRRA